jgi:hypothetical protein
MYQDRAGLAMPRPNFPSPFFVSTTDNVYLPFLGNKVLDFSFDLITALFGRGPIEFIAMEDSYRDRTDPPEERFVECWRIRFGDVLDFQNGGFDARIILFPAHQMDNFVYFDHFDVSGLCCPSDGAKRILHRGIDDHFTSLRRAITAYEEEDERNYLFSVIEHAENIADLLR